MLRFPFAVIGFAVGVLVALAPGCGPTSTPCTATSCLGCCDAAGACQAGNASDQCGRDGALCRACTAGEQCLQSVCRLNGAAGGSGGGTAGGSGGGTAGGSGGGTAGGSGGGAPQVTVSVGSCGAVAPCQTNLAGTWFYTQACVDDPIADYTQYCATMTLSSFTGTLSGRIDISGTAWTRAVTTTYTAAVDIPSACTFGSCASIESVLQSTSPGATCVTQGGGCACTLTGSSTTTESGTVTQAAGVLTVTPSQGATRTYDACAQSASPGTLRLRESTSSAPSSERGTTTLTRQ